jgi:hypothetical protein
MATTTDVRQWLRDQGREVSDRGKLPRALHAEYEAAHGGQDAAADEDRETTGPGMYDLGVTEQDFIAADEPPDEPPDEPAEALPAAPAAAAPQGHQDERRPRRIRRQRATAASFRERIWSGGGAKPARPAKKHPRMSLRGLFEDGFLDAAWTFQGLPPLEKILYLQAPFAGSVADDALKGTVVDRALQPVARANDKYKKMEALTAPLWVALIMAKGRRDEHGRYSPETQLMFSGLRHSLLSMSRVVESFDFEQQKEKADQMRTASGQIDAMIAYLFEMPEPTEEQLREMAEAQRAAQAQAN